MKNFSLIFSLVCFLFGTVTKAQNNKNLVLNGSFEEISRPPHCKGDFKQAKNISSANNSSIDLYSEYAYSKKCRVPKNCMGTQLSKEGSNYIGIAAFYTRKKGIFNRHRNNKQYSQYVQMELASPLEAGKPYTINFNVSLAGKSAYAVSGMGVYFSSEKVKGEKNAFLEVTPHLVACEFISKPDWETVSGTYIAKGGERFLTLGCFKVCMDTVKLSSQINNKSGIAYYYMDDISVTPETTPQDDISSVLYGNCFRLQALNFQPQQSTILPESYEELKYLAHFLRTYPFLVVYIDGHTNGVDEKSSAALSVERAEEVKKYLVAYGVNADQLRTRGFGNEDPIDPANTNYIKNERVEITLCVVE